MEFTCKFQPEFGKIGYDSKLAHAARISNLRKSSKSLKHRAGTGSAHTGGMYTNRITRDPSLSALRRTTQSAVTGATAGLVIGQMLGELLGSPEDGRIAGFVLGTAIGTARGLSTEDQSR
jgi:hypothetical protein